MAQVIPCDVHGFEHAADWLVTHLEDGETTGYCNAAYAELMVTTAAAMAQAEAEAADAEAERKLEAVGPAKPTTAPARIVRKGTSCRARRARARASAKVDAAGFTVTAPASGPDDDEDDDADATGIPVTAEPGSLADRILTSST